MKKNIIFVGLDAHKDSIDVALDDAGRDGDDRFYGTTGGDLESRHKVVDQVNLTDEESRIMPVSGGSFEQAFNAQAAEDTASKLVVATHVTQQSNDKQEPKPTPENLAAMPKKLGTVTELVADNGYFSGTNIIACEDKCIALDRQEHCQQLWDRFREPPLLPDDADSVTG